MKDVGQEVKKYDTNGGHLYKRSSAFPTESTDTFSSSLLLRCCDAKLFLQYPQAHFSPHGGAIAAIVLLFEALKYGQAGQVVAFVIFEIRYQPKQLHISAL